MSPAHLSGSARDRSGIRGWSQTHRQIRADGVAVFRAGPEIPGPEASRAGPDDPARQVPGDGDGRRKPEVRRSGSQRAHEPIPARHFFLHRAKKLSVISFQSSVNKGSPELKTEN